MAPFVQTGPFSRQFWQPVEALPGNIATGLSRLAGGLGRVTDYLSSTQAAQDYTNLLRGKFGAPAAPLTGIQTGKYGPSDWQKTANPAVAAAAPSAPPSPSAVVAPGHAAAPAAPAQPPAPPSLATYQLAAQQKAPLGTPLADYYGAQSAAGRASQAEVVRGLTQGKTGIERDNLETWAKANPMLAWREYQKQFPSGNYATGPLGAQTGAPFNQAGPFTPSPQFTQQVQGAFSPEQMQQVAAAPWSTQPIVTGSYNPAAVPNRGFNPSGMPVDHTEQGLPGFSFGQSLAPGAGDGKQNPQVAAGAQDMQRAFTSGSSAPAFDTTDSLNDRALAFIKQIRGQ